MPPNVAKMSKIIGFQLEDDDEITKSEVDCSRISGAILRKVMDFCTKYQEEKMHEITTPLIGDTMEEMVKPAWCAKFCEGVELNTLFDLVEVSVYLDIQPLSALSCLAVYEAIKGKSVEERRQIFNLPEPKPTEN